MNLKLIISDAFQFFRTNLGQIGALCLPWLLAVAVVEYLIVISGEPTDDVGPFFLLAWMFNLLIYPVYTAALILMMAQKAQQEQPGNRELLASAIKLWQPFFMVHVMVAALTALGLMFFVVPGIYVAVRLSFAEFYIVLEDVKPMEALQKSFLATKPHAIQLFILLAMFAIPLLLLRFFLGSILSSPEAQPFFNVAGAAFMGFLMLFLDVVMFRAFMAVTQEGPGANNPAMD